MQASYVRGFINYLNSRQIKLLLFNDGNLTILPENLHIDTKILHFIGLFILPIEASLYPALISLGDFIA